MSAIREVVVVEGGGDGRDAVGRRVAGLGFAQPTASRRLGTDERTVFEE